MGIKISQSNCCFANKKKVKNDNLPKQKNDALLK